MRGLLYSKSRLIPQPEDLEKHLEACTGQLEAAILEGRLTAGAILPSTRNSQALFGVSRNTAAEVYERLAIAGHVVTHHGSGTYVADGRVSHQVVEFNTGSSREQRLNSFWLRPDVEAAMGFWRDRMDEAPTGRKLSVDFRPAIIDSRLFPFDAFRRVSARQLRALETRPARYKSPSSATRAVRCKR